MSSEMLLGSEMLLLGISPTLFVVVVTCRGGHMVT
jgi:hypothetical protein